MSQTLVWVLNQVMVRKNVEQKVLGSTVYSFNDTISAFPLDTLTVCVLSIIVTAYNSDLFHDESDT